MPDYIGQLLVTSPDFGSSISDLGVVPSDQSKIQNLNDEIGEALTEREFETLRLLATELSVPEIAEEMVVATSTTRSHVKSIYSKLNVHSRLQVIQRAKTLGLL